MTELGGASVTHEASPGQEPAGPWPLRLAVLGDIHVGPTARSSDLAPAWLGRTDEGGFLERFLDFARNDVGVVDALLVPGDLTDRADPTEFEKAAAVIEQIAETLGLDWDTTYFVPGNHDSNWTLASSFPHDSTTFSKTHRYAPLLFEAFPFRSRLLSGSEAMCAEPYFTIWSDQRLLVIGFNSSSDDGPNVAPHFGIAPSSSIHRLSECLDGITPDPNQVRLLLVHHHLMDLPAPVPSVPDFSQMQNATELLDVLTAHRVDLAIHGHRHVPSFRPWIDTTDTQIVILGAGSFSARLDTRYSGHVGNQFHVVDIEGRDAASQSLVGRVRTWSYGITQSWEPASEISGLEHLEGFGPLVRPDTLAAAVEAVLADFAAGSLDYLEVKDLRQEVPGLENVSSKAFRSAVNEACGRTNTRIVGSPPDQVILRRGP